MIAKLAPTRREIPALVEDRLYNEDVRPWLRILNLLVAAMAATLPASGQVVLDGTIGPESGLVAPGIDDQAQAATYLIEDSLGERAGGNLFHSFSRFDIEVGETATFISNSPTAIDNVLARVTGGAESRIQGTLRSTIPGADLFLMNPAGVVFSEGSSVDVPQGFHVTTGHYLRHADGTRFEANAAAAPVLTTAPIEAFGFLDPPIGNITIDDARLELNAGQSLSLIGGDIAILGEAARQIGSPDDPAPSPPAMIRVPSGQIHVVAIQSAGEVTDALSVEPFQTLGRVLLDDAGRITASGDPGGAIHIRARGLELRGGSSMSSETLGGQDHAGLGIDIQARGDVSMRQASLSANTSGDGDAGGIRIEANALQATDTAISSENTGGGSGQEGEVDIIAGEVQLINGAQLVEWSLTRAAPILPAPEIDPDLEDFLQRSSDPRTRKPATIALTIDQARRESTKLQRARCGAGWEEAGSFSVYASPGVPPPPDDLLPSVLMEFGTVALPASEPAGMPGEAPENCS